MERQCWCSSPSSRLIFVFSYPGGRLVEVVGYKRAMVTGLEVMGCGACGFIPASSLASFPVFLCAFVVLAAGMTTVQVAANPYVTIIGPAGTASSRLNLAQAFNSVGAFISPFFGAMFILKGANPPRPRCCIRCLRHHASSTALQRRPRFVSPTSAWPLSFLPRNWPGIH